MVRFVVLLPTILMGCGRSFDFGGAETWTAPDGAIYHHVKCKADKQLCIDYAASTCGSSYQVIGSETHSGGIFKDNCPGGVTWRSLYYQCGPGDGAIPTFRYSGPNFAEAIIAHLNGKAQIDTAQPFIQPDQLPVSQEWDPDMCSDG